MKITLFIDINEISVPVAEVLAQVSAGYELSLGLKNASDLVLDALSKTTSRLRLDELTTLTAQQSSIISRYSGELLSLSGIKQITDEAADNLSRYRGRLIMNGLESLSDAAADSFSHIGSLSFDGVSFLSDSAVQSLAKSRGDLKLNGIKALGDKAIDYLSKRNDGRLSLGITKLSDESAAKLSESTLENLDLDGLTRN